MDCSDHFLEPRPPQVVKANSDAGPNFEVGCVVAFLKGKWKWIDPDHICLRVGSERLRNG